MEHVVFHSSSDGTPAFRRFGALDEAVRFVEHLRNVEGVEDASVHVLTPVPLSFRAYYKVEVPAVEALAAVPAQPMDADPVEAAPADLAPADVVPEPEQAVAANGKRTLGFFAG
jgi:hypothetical protein